MKDEKEFEEEVQQVKKLLDQRKNYRQIAEILNKSIFWVFTRTRHTYGTSARLSTFKFQNQAIVPFLEKHKHTILEKTVIKYVSVVSQLKNQIYISEGVIKLTSNDFERALGRLSLCSVQHTTPIKQLFLPKEFEIVKGNYLFRIGIYNLERDNVKVIFI